MIDDWTIDVCHAGRRGYVAVQVLVTSEGPVLVDTGPASTLTALAAGLAHRGHRLRDIRAVLLSHIHLDHAGAIGQIAAAAPEVDIYVHRRGVKHLADPSQLLASARQIYGDRMEALWGEIVRTPADRLIALEDGMTITIGGRRFEVAETPGHAPHHVGYFEAAERTAYLGDAGGIRITEQLRAMPVTPPPNFHLERWLASIDRIAQWQPSRLFCTHFGFWGDPRQHLDDVRAGLEHWVVTAERLLADDAVEPDAKPRAFAAAVRASLEGTAPPTVVDQFLEFADLQSSWRGLTRYLEERRAARPSGTRIG